MKCSMKTFSCLMAVFGLTAYLASQAAAVPLTLNLTNADSYISIASLFSGIPTIAQDGTGGTVDSVAGSPSTRTTFQGTISIDVDDLFAPTNIKILSSAADADVSGRWLPEVELYEDLDGDGRFGEVGLPTSSDPNADSGDSRPTQGDNPAPSANADWGIKVFFAPLGADIAFGAHRDISYNVTSGLEAVNGLGQFSSLSENFEFATGWLDYWVANGVPGGNIRGRAELAGGDDNNMSAASSTYAVTPLGGGMSQITLFLPISIDDGGSDLQTVYTGQFVATAIVPEPASFVLLSLAGSLLACFRASRRS